MSLHGLPPRLIFIDVETTGLHSADRIVSLGAVELATGALRDGRLEAECTHLIFDPEKKSHPRAEDVHGYDDWTLRHQQPFSEHADSLRRLFEAPKIVWAHNAEFDHAFIDREFQRAGFGSVGPLNCTMQLYRRQHPGERSSLKAITASLGISRLDERRHGALEDAWLAMLVYLNEMGVAIRDVPHEALILPTNLRPPPPLTGPLPRRSRKKQQHEFAAHVVETAPPRHLTDVLAAMRPTATLMMFVALADGEVAESEWATILELVDDTAGRLEIKLERAQCHDMVASLLTPDGPPFSVRDAAAAVVRDPHARDNIARWIRAVTFADGRGSAQENHAIVAITNALSEARQTYAI